MYMKNDCEPLIYGSREAWLYSRRRYICASDTACVLGFGFKSRTEIWEAKSGKNMSQCPDSDAMRKGRESEDYIKALYAIDNDIPIHDGTDVLVIDLENKDSKGEPFMAATLDGWGLKDGEPFALEIKRSESPMQFRNGPPLKYRAQCLKQMIVTGFRRAVLLARICPNEWNNMNGAYEKTFEFSADDPDVEYDMQMIIEEERRFWEEYVLTGKRPPDMLPRI